MLFCVLSIKVKTLLFLSPLAGVDDAKVLHGSLGPHSTSQCKWRLRKPQ